MAEPKKLDVFRKTEPAPPPADNSDLDQGNIKASGIGLRAGEIAAIDAIAASLELTRNAVMRWAVRWFIIQYRAGRVDLAASIEEPPPPKKKLKY